MMEQLYELARRAWHVSFDRIDPGDEKGFSYAFMVVILPILLGFMGLVIEVGMVTEVRRELQTAADAGALAGAQMLPNSPADAVTAAEEYVTDNGKSPNGAPIVSTTYAENDTITVNTIQTVPLVLMPILGYANAQDVGATATAIVGILGVDDCPLPLGIVDANGTGLDGTYESNGFGYSFNSPVTMTLSNDVDYHGNFQPLAIFGDRGASVFYQGLEGNCDPDWSVAVGPAYTEPGFEVKKVADTLTSRIAGDPPGGGDPLTHFSEVVSLQPDGRAIINGHPDGSPCPRIVVVPIIDKYQVSGRSDPIRILAFAHMYLVSADYDKDTKVTTVTGIFIDTLTPGDWMPFAPTGARVVRLMR